MSVRFAPMPPAGGRRRGVRPIPAAILLAALALGFGAPDEARAGRREWVLETELFTLHFVKTPIQPIPLLSFPDDVSRESFAAWCADNGNEMFAFVRDHQEESYWYRVDLDPPDGPDGPLTWPDALRPALQLKNGRTVGAQTVVGMRGMRFSPPEETSPACVLARLFPADGTLRFSDVATPTGEVIGYAGFPRNFDPSEVSGIELGTEASRSVAP